ncbi:nitrate reductase [Vibrio sp. 10N.286.49.C2]|uniref:molybdopterin oxidoreductase family protein n=2 Tax=Vibrio TaxID=662 RepID=UPI000CBB1E1B|nr:MULTISPECIES: nitrate reductase [unclassified Vibrio]PMH35124.1 nitrate reductase [Vibrio sp. 10N.286.49.C2]PMH50912.1 nitrate reductase [Vibrio sp. 10N.286.49.B1]PMH83574.1 nitrate reductase [Vibrio sp. 10N.286.48.B7]
MMDEDGWTKSTCPYCGVGCGVEARPTAKGRLEIRGDQSHPSNYGKLCTKGIALGETVIHDGRARYPLLRSYTTPDASTNKGYQPTSSESHSRVEYTDTICDWEDITSHVAKKFTQTIEQFGPDSVAFYVSGQLLTEDYYVANKLMKGFIGSGNIDSNSRLCMASSVVGHKRAFGSDTVPVCYEDLEHAELVIITGSNLAWCHPVLFQRLRLAKQQNPAMTIVVVDPRETATCDIADLHLPIHSGSDVALFNGLLTYLHRDKHLDKDYIAAFTDGFEQALDAASKELDIEGITGINTDRLEHFYSLFAKTDKVVTVYSQGVNQSSQGSDKVNAILNCHLATGKIGQQGTGPFSVTGQPNAMGGREVGGLANTLASHMEFDNPQHHSLIRDYWQTDQLATKPGLKAIDLFDAIESGTVKAIWIMATNPVVSLPDSKKIQAALSRCPFVVVSDCIQDTETTQFADVIFPSQGWSEKSGTVTNSERRISRQRRILPSPGLAKPDWWIISQVAKKMGFASAFNYLHEGQIFSEYATMTTLGNDTGQRDLNLIGLTSLDDQGYSRLSPQQWPVTTLQSDVVNQRLFSDNQFFTPNKRAQFIRVRHQSPKNSVSVQHPLILNSGRARDHWHTMSRTGLSPSLATHTPEPYVTLHPVTAKRYSLEQGQIATISNHFGSIQARVHCSTSMGPNQLFMPIHWNDSTASNSKPCTLIEPNSDRHSGQPEFKHTPVSITRWHHRCEALLFSQQPLALDTIEYWAQQKVENGYLYRIASPQNPMQLIVALTAYMALEGDKTLSFDGGESAQGFRQAQITSAYIDAAFVVKTVVSELDVDWLMRLVSEPDGDLLEQHFMMV